jgi:putative SOS response-associated peptidase YedK
MPAMLRPANCEVWLDPSGYDVERLQPHVCPYPSEEMQTYPVSARVNNLANYAPECITPLARPPSHQPQAGPRVSAMGAFVVDSP